MSVNMNTAATETYNRDLQIAQRKTAPPLGSAVSSS
jgi:hypothetical protein